MVNYSAKRFSNTILVILALAILGVFASGVPFGPDTLVEITSSRYTNVSPNETEAQAGNVTEITMTAQAPTQAWQGFYGNVSGTLTLENSAGDVFYDWNAAEPKGEVYSSTNSSITWTSVRCFNFSNATANGGVINMTTEEARYGIDDTDVDGINETFNYTTHDQFFVGSVNIAANTCNSMYVNQNSVAQTENFQNVLLVDNSTGANTLIFVTIMENNILANDTDIVGYDNTTTDFQLMVAEDGHGAQSLTTTTYYFWVEIE